MVEDAADERVGGLGQPEAARVVVGGEHRRAAAGQRQVQVQAAAGLVGERLGHEGRDHAALGGDHRQQVAQRDHAVGGGQRLGELEVLLELAVAVLVVVGVVGPAERVHRRRDRGEVVIHPGDAAGVVAGLGGGVGGVGDRQAAVGVAVQQEVLDLGADPRLEAGVGGSLRSAT